MRGVAAAVVAAGLALPAASTARADECASPATQQAADACAGRALQKSDGALNAAYKEIMARLKGDSATAKLLVRAERDWVAFRDAECAFAASAVAQGSIYPMIVTNCRDGLTRKRSDELKAYLHCQEGDLSCPVSPR